MPLPGPTSMTLPDTGGAVAASPWSSTAPPRTRPCKRGTTLASPSLRTCGPSQAQKAPNQASWKCDQLVRGGSVARPDEVDDGGHQVVQRVGHEDPRIGEA